MFTFKTDKPTGKYKSFSDPYHHIRIKRKDVGSIDHNHPYRIRLMVTKKDIMEDGNPNCDWRWVVIKRQFTSMEEAKMFLNEYYEEITKTFNLRKEE